MDLILNINKPKGISSFQVVKLLRKRIATKSIGYIGTLDPLATGVLPVFCGNFTKLIPFVNDNRKRYKFNIEFGMETDSLDITGNIVKSDNRKIVITKELLKNIIEKFFLGKIKQKVPAYSAIKINGQRAYKMARNKQKTDMPYRDIELFNYTIESIKDNHFIGTIETSKGFYVRAFARDIAYKIDTFGTIVELNRLRSGDFYIEDSVDLDDIDKSKGIDIVDLMRKYMKVEYCEKEKMKKIKNGLIMPCNKKDTYILYINKDMDSIAICEINNGELKTKRIIR